jgi:hypothetical protein
MLASNPDRVDPRRETPRPAQEIADQTGGRPRIVRRRRFDGLVIATVAGCALILVAAAISRVSHASSGAQAQPPMHSPAASIAAEPVAAATMSPPGAGAPVAAVTEPAPIEQPTKGTVRLDRASLAGRVWVDGKRLTSTAAVVTCGPHQIKVGAGTRARSLDVPCGGELVVAR